MMASRDILLKQKDKIAAQQERIAELEAVLEAAKPVVDWLFVPGTVEMWVEIEGMFGGVQIRGKAEFLRELKKLRTAVYATQEAPDA